MFCSDALLLPHPLIEAARFPYTPFFVGLSLVIVAVSLVFIVYYPPLKRQSVKRKIVSFTVLVLILTFFTFQVDFSTRRAHVDFSIDDTEKRFYTDKNNTINVQCSNRGDKEGYFYLVLHLKNASALPLTQEYVYIGNTTVKVPFTLPDNNAKDNFGSKPVGFVIDDNVTSIAFSLSIESITNPVDIGISPISGLTYVWNTTEKCFIPKYGAGYS